MTLVAADISPLHLIPSNVRALTSAATVSEVQGTKKCFGKSLPVVCPKRTDTPTFGQSAPSFNHRARNVGILPRVVCNASTATYVPLRIVEAAIQKNLNSTATKPFQRERHVAIPETASAARAIFSTTLCVCGNFSPRPRLVAGRKHEPDKRCSFDCSIARWIAESSARDEAGCGRDGAELHKTLAFVLAGKLHGRPWYSTLSKELLTLRHVALSGDGNNPRAEFAQAVESIVHIRALAISVLQNRADTNATGLTSPGAAELETFHEVRRNLAKLDGGTQAFFNQWTGRTYRWKKVLANILLVARQRP